MTLLREDGTVTVFIIKHQQKDGKWVKSNLDHFRFADNGWSKSINADVGKAFSASGNCWQSTGIHGVFDAKTGLAGLDAICRANPGYRFGLFKLRLSQESSEVASMMLTEDAADA